MATIGGLPFGAKGIAAATVVASSLLAVPSITYAGRPICIGAALVIRAVGIQLIGAICAAAAGWWLQVEAFADYSSFVRVLSLGACCTCIYLAIVVGVFRLVEPIKVAGSIVQDLLGESIAPGQAVARRSRR